MTAFGDSLAEKGLGGFLHLLQDEGGNLRGGIGLALRLDPGVAGVGFDDLERSALILESVDRRSGVRSSA